MMLVFGNSQSEHIFGECREVKCQIIFPKSGIKVPGDSPLFWEDNFPVVSDPWETFPNYRDFLLCFS